MTEEDACRVTSNMHEKAACNDYVQKTHADDTPTRCESCQATVHGMKPGSQSGSRASSCGETQEVGLSDGHSATQKLRSATSQLTAAKTNCSNNILAVEDKQNTAVINFGDVSNKEKGSGEVVSEVVSNCFEQRGLPATIPSVVVSDTTVVDDIPTLKDKVTLPDQDTAKACMEKVHSGGARKPKIEHICESSSSLDSNSGDILLGDSSEHILLSPRRSCDSAYSSSMDTGGSTDNQQDDPGISFSVIESGDFSGTNASSAEDSPGHKIHCSTLTVGILRKNAASPYSSSSSIASDMDTSLKGDEPSLNTLAVHDSLQHRKLSSSSSCSLRLDFIRFNLLVPNHWFYFI